jgi:GNAT superfamily N-acetyltransferase
MTPIFRKATESDLPAIINLLANDEFGKTREKTDAESLKIYAATFAKINRDENQFLAVVEMEKEVIGTCHLTIIHSLTFTALTRLNIEAVRISDKHSGQGIGSWMIKQAIEFGKSHGAKMFQLTSGNKRTRAHKFYEKLGFEATHVGMKLFLQ